MTAIAVEESPAPTDPPKPVTYHIYPTHGREHVTAVGEPCWCAPTVTDDGLCIHRESN